MRAIGKMLRDGARCDKTGQQWRDFLEFHAQNPWVYDKIKQMVHSLKRRGWTHYSMRTMIAVLRFEWDLRTTGADVPTTDGERSVKLNDHHSPYYARLLVEEYPVLWDFFEFRECDGDPFAPEDN